MSQLRPLPMFETAPHGAVDDEAGFGVLATERGCLPLESIDVRARVDGLLARVDLAQAFVNPTEVPLEATYIFPLPPRAGVTSFRMEVAGRVVEGTLREREEARATYERAIEDGRRAAIAEEERPGVFTIRVGNLMPGERAVVRLTLAGVLPYADGEVTFRFPLVVAPRYVPGMPLPGPAAGDGVAADTDAAPDASRISPPVLLDGFPNPVRLGLSVEVHGIGSDPAAAGLRSSLHAVWATAEGGACRVTLQPGGGERLDRDFILRFRLGGETVWSSASFHPDGDSAGTFALTIVPPVAAAGPRGPRPRDVAFVLDRSGSMEGWKIVAARRALARMVDALGPADRFAVLAFSSWTEAPPTLGRGLVAATDRNRFRAVEFLSGISAHGGTEMAGPLREAAAMLGDRRSRRERVLVLVTDGQVANEDQILGSLAPALKGARVFTLGIDQAVNEGFLNRLATIGGPGGGCELVESEERLDEVLESIHRRIATPVLSDLRVTPEGWEIESDSLVPGRAGVVFEGAPRLILGRYRGTPGTLLLKARTPDGAEWSEAVAGQVRENRAIAAAWARGQVRKLEDRYLTEPDGQRELERAIVATSLAHGVLSRFTAFVAVDLAGGVVNPGGGVHQVVQPVSSPAGWKSTGAPGVSRHAVARDISPPAIDFRDAFGRFAAPSGLSLSRLSRLWSRPAPPSGPPPARSRREPEPPSRPAPSAPGPDDHIVDFGPLPVSPLPTRFGMGSFLGVENPGYDYRAYDHEGGRWVVVKAIPLRDAEQTQRARVAFERVAEAIRSTGEPALLGPVEVVAEGEVVFLISVDCQDGRPLDDLVGPGSSSIPPLEAARIVRDVASLLARVHARGLVHGGIKASQVLVGPGGRVSLTDVGVFAALQEVLPGDAGVITGAPVSISPEMLAGDGRPVPASDVYALGALLYRLLTGRFPFGDTVGRKRLRTIMDGAPAPPRSIVPTVPKALDAICLRAMAREPSGRPTAGELADELTRFLDREGGRRSSRKPFWK